jgi:hypothetical protein
MDIEEKSEEILEEIDQAMNEDPMPTLEKCLEFLTSIESGVRTRIDAIKEDIKRR